MCFENVVYIVYGLKFKNIGNDVPFPLPMYCALPIASLDLLERI